MGDGYEKLKAHLSEVADTVGAEFSALFVPSEDGEALRLACSTQVDHGAIEWVEAAWAHKRAELLAGRALRDLDAVLWPLMDEGRFAALVYLNVAPGTFPSPRDRSAGQALVERLRPRRPPKLPRLIALGARPLSPA